MPHPLAVILDLLKNSTEYLLIITISLWSFIFCCAHYSKYTLKIGNFQKLLIIIFQVTGTLLGIAPDLTAVVLCRNVLAFCKSIMFKIGFFEELKVRFCMPVKIISNAKDGQIKPMSYLSNEICNILEILDVVTIHTAVICSVMDDGTRQFA